MTDREAYQLGIIVGRRARLGLRPMVNPANLPLPRGIHPHTSQAQAYRLGYNSELKGKATVIIG